MVNNVEQNDMFVTNWTDALRKMEQGNYAFIDEYIAWMGMTPVERCNFHRVGDVLVPVFYGMGLQKGIWLDDCVYDTIEIQKSQIIIFTTNSDSPLKDILDISILDNYNSGTVKILKNEWIPNEDGLNCEVK